MKKSIIAVLIALVLSLMATFAIMAIDRQVLHIGKAEAMELIYQLNHDTNADQNLDYNHHVFDKAHLYHKTVLIGEGGMLP